MNRERTRTLRVTTMAVVAITVIIGAASNAGTGSLSAFGRENLSAVCPLGYLETALASRDLMPPLLLSFFMIAGLTVLLGRVFCGWICPIPLVRKLLINKIDEDLTNGKRASRDDSAPPACQPGEKEKHTVIEKNSSSGIVILGAALGSSAIFGFPVFCLICPIGLVFATLFALIRLVRFNEPALDLLIFPVIIIVELLLLKKWCSQLCPVGALLGLFSRFNRGLVPTVDRSRCREESLDTKCQNCRRACSFDIDIRNGEGTGRISDCTKCRECADSCPVHAIRFPWR